MKIAYYLYINDFNFDVDNIQTVKNALLLSSTADGNLYGKTGTGNINGENISGWFIGYVETSDNTYFFALNIGATENATGSKASDIALSILSDMNIWYWKKVKGQMKHFDPLPSVFL